MDWILLVAMAALRRAGTPLTGDVVLVAENDGNGLVVDALVGQKHRLALGAGCTLAAVHEVDGAAVDLL